MTQNQFISIGECMIELSGGENDQYRLGFAGDTLNTAWYARAGLPQDWDVAYFSAIGTDSYSDRMEAFLSGNQIKTDHLARLSDKRPGLYLIAQVDGDRHFTYWRENSAAKQLARDPSRLASALNSAQLIYISGITLAILDEGGRANLYQALHDARVQGAKVAFDPNIRPALWPDAEAMRREIALVCAHVDLAFPTFDDDAALFGDADLDACAARYHGYGVAETIVKNGAEEALIATELDRVLVPAQKVGQVVDATGAGDSFGGAYLSQRMQGKDLRQSAEFAHKIAAQVVQHHGALMAYESINISDD